MTFSSLDYFYIEGFYWCITGDVKDKLHSIKSQTNHR